MWRNGKNEMWPQEKALSLVGQIIAQLNVLTFFERSDI